MRAAPCKSVIVLTSPQFLLCIYSLSLPPSHRYRTDSVQTPARSPFFVVTLPAVHGYPDCPDICSGFLSSGPGSAPPPSTASLHGQQQQILLINRKVQGTRSRGPLQTDPGRENKVPPPPRFLTGSTSRPSMLRPQHPALPASCTCTGRAGDSPCRPRTRPRRGRCGLRPRTAGPGSWWSRRSRTVLMKKDRRLVRRRRLNRHRSRSRWGRQTGVQSRAPSLRVGTVPRSRGRSIARSPRRRCDSRRASNQSTSGSSRGRVSQLGRRSGR